MTLDERARRAAEGLRRAVETLDRTSLGADVFERFNRYRERKQRNQRVRIIVLAIAVALIASVVVLRAFTPVRNVPAGPPTGTILYGEWDTKIQQAHWFTVSADGSGVKDLGVVATCAQWWPDGSRIFITDDANVAPGSPLRPATIAPDGSGLVRLDATDEPMLDLGCGDVSPDMRRIAVEGFGRPSVRGIYTVRASDGGGLARVTHGRDSYPQYGPHGQRIVFLRTKPGVNPDGAGALFVVNTDGTGLRRITPWGFSFLQYSWSPNGEWIVFEHPYGQLYLVQPDGSGLEPLPLKLPSGSGAMMPQWSPDGGWITFTLQQGKIANVYIVRPDGTGLRAITRSKDAQETSPDWTIGS